jgi:hypothetical protein
MHIMRQGLDRVGVGRAGVGCLGARLDLGCRATLLAPLDGAALSLASGSVRTCSSNGSLPIEGLFPCLECLSALFVTHIRPCRLIAPNAG